MSEESLMPERDALWAKHDGLTPKLAAEMCELAGKLELERNGLRQEAATLRAALESKQDDRWTIEAFKAATNTIMRALVRKWEAEGERCGEEGRHSDKAWDDDGDEWRERRAVYFECAEELKAALGKFPDTQSPPPHPLSCPGTTANPN